TPPGYFARTGAGVLCLGAGGAGHAITLALMSRPYATDRPARIAVVEKDPARLQSIQSLHRTLAGDVPVDYLENADPIRNDALLATLQPGSLVINATGMGKDLPGSPLSAAARWPQHAI